MAEPAAVHVDANGVDLSVYTLGNSNGPPLVMLHGMRDVALGLLPVAEALSDDFSVVLPDLRGHGKSARPGGYAMPQFLFDLHQVLDALGIERAALLGHSLGGQIVGRFAALFPRRVTAAVIVEGLGPPARPFTDDPEQALEWEAARLLESLGAPPSTRALPDLAFAAARLIANNPRLSQARAAELARAATELDADGRRVWAFDPRARSVFTGLPPADGERYWRAVRARTLIVSGALAHEYWGGAMADGTNWEGRFAPGELEARVALFRNAEHVLFEGSGHMVHFDEPERLARVVGEFLRRAR
jgi:pimeloyl-ACP methyl ester carboxylesterase